ncbi:hypothetical protein O6H91_19G082600 [Diphasiastrum complanatum]|uniref:Uncharacterized protein n=4 Tax=Diphasiastrum complanatum TaxID=34168 RepID=A0ACC2AYD0_DIPCM|nr:hypothetical protein O6H91_19G082600 [Diphasiastrum complanatum]KAJ7522084.1 hypothetical protein O6H91_19G082600 [Diphasiastrum complanatum]KAJ7522087.1 hypothetical protein O6H91_19G082600 [Diphasiastrum complanatum]
MERQSASQHKDGARARSPPLHLIRRQVARILRILLKGDAQRRAQGTIRSLVYKPSVVAKRATLALTCGTLKYLQVLKEVLASTDLITNKRKVQAELVYVLTYDVLFGQEVLPIGDAEKLVLSRKHALRAALARLLVKKNVASADKLLPSEVEVSDYAAPRYVRVNTLKIGVNDAFEVLSQFTDVQYDDMIPYLLVLPAGTDLHDHSLVLQGSLFLQGKASCMPAQALDPIPEWEVLDACAAPGNKTVQLAAIMKGRGRILACEQDRSRLKTLKKTVELAGASNIEVLHQDFLQSNPFAAKFSKVRAILLDPSCSGSGTTLHRLDNLLPSFAKGQLEEDKEKQRVECLARFQEAALRHALSFPAVERIIYSTCSINKRENEDVVASVLPFAHAHNFELATAFPEWPHRGLEVVDGAHHLLRTDAARDKTDGFFIALFVREQSWPSSLAGINLANKSTSHHAAVEKEQDVEREQQDEAQECMRVLTSFKGVQTESKKRRQKKKQKKKK